MKIKLLMVITLITIIILVLSITISSQVKTKTITNSKNEIFITMTDLKVYTIDWIEYDTVKLINNKTKKSYTFRLDKEEAYTIEGECYFKQDIVKKLNKNGA